MATYGYDTYGNSTYGPAAPGTNYPGSSVTIPVVNTAFILDKLGAQALDHKNILVEWGNLPPGTMATVTEFRILASPWGFPVDQNDGTAILDVTGAPPAPGIQLVDTTGTPGRVQYYGVYVLSGGNWLRAGFTACLLPKYYGYDTKLMADLPPFFQSQAIGTVATNIQVASPNVPSSGGSVTNPYSYAVNVWLSETANVMVNGIPLGQVTYAPLPANGTITVTYSGSLTWQWINPASNSTNTALTDFLKILGFGLDTVKSQYDMKFRSLNDPMLMSLGDLVNLCAQIGLPYNSEVPAYAMRKAALYWGTVMQERSTISGIGEHITLLTGYAADIQISRNIMLDDDQSSPLDPQRAWWSANTEYQVGELVTFPNANSWSIVSSYAVGAVVSYNDLLYTCILANSGQYPTNATYWSQNVNGPYTYVCIAAVTSLPGTAPSGAMSNTTNWAFLYGGTANGSSTYFANLPLITNAYTWEFTNASGSNYGEDVGTGFPTPQTWTQSGSTPVTPPSTFANTFRALNNTGSTITSSYLRSVARTAADITAGHVVPDPQIVVEHAVPVPVSMGQWNANTTYYTNQIVTYNNVPYIALRQSVGATPPALGSVLNQNYDFETTLTPWISDGTCTLTDSSTYAYHGTKSMEVSYTTPASGFATGVHAVSENITVIPGATYQASALVYSNTIPSGLQAQLSVNWSDTFGGYINGAFPPTVILTAATWTKLTTTFTVPNNAGTVYIAPSMTTPTASTAYATYWDVVELTCIATPEWAPLNTDGRMPVTMSGYAIADLGITPTTTAGITPFVEWYDNWGNIISRVFARGTSGGSFPTNYNFDAFDTGAGYPVSGRVPTNPAAVWSVPAGSWTISGNGIAYAGSSDSDALGVLPSPAAGTAAVTVTNPAQSGDDCGVLFWFTNTSGFWVAGLLQLYWVASGVTHTLAYTGTAPATGDRIYAQFNNTTSTTTLPSGNTVIGPSVVVYKNTLTTSNILVVVGSGGTQSQTALSSLTGAVYPGTGATTSNAGIASIAV